MNKDEDIMKTLMMMMMMMMMTTTTTTTTSVPTYETVFHNTTCTCWTDDAIPSLNLNKKFSLFKISMYLLRWNGAIYTWHSSL